MYLVLVAAALIEGLIRPLQTLSNVVSSMREGDYSFRARGASAQDALGELAGEVNALADLLQKQRVRSLEATALLARILEVMHAPLFAFDRDDTLQLVNNAGLKLLGLPHARSFGRTARELGLEELLRAPDQTIHTFNRDQKPSAGPVRWLLRKATFRQEGAPHTLLLLADVSVPLQEEEQVAWKRLIRVLGHELSNSLAPIKSIAGSLLGRVDTLQGNDGTLSDFRRGLGVVESRADSLHRFVQSYRQLAQLPQPRLMARLPTRFAFRLLLADRLGRPERVGRRRRRGIAAVGAEPRYQGGDALLQLGDASVAGTASNTLRRVHAAMLESRTARSCACFLEKSR